MKLLSLLKKIIDPRPARRENKITPKFSELSTENRFRYFARGIGICMTCDPSLVLFFNEMRDLESGRPCFMVGHDVQLLTELPKIKTPVTPVLEVLK